MVLALFVSNLICLCFYMKHPIGNVCVSLYFLVDTVRVVFFYVWLVDFEAS